jgi:thiosulfate dehydrogenase (quinone) large subunit
MNINKIVWMKLRFIMSFIFLWAFLDKTFGLGFATPSDKAWIKGASPTSGFLTHAVKGPFADIFRSMAGMPLVDWMFMLGLLFIGVTLLLNKHVVWGAFAGGLMMLFMWLALLPPENNPIVDEHVVYILVFALLALHSKKH